MLAEVARDLPEPRPIAETRDPLPPAAQLDRFLAEIGGPMVFRGAGRNLPIVQAARRSSDDAMAYLRQMHAGRPLTVYRAGPDAGGRFHYNDGVDGFNFTAAKEDLGPLLGKLAGDPAQTIYVGSTDLDLFFPGLGTANDPGVAGVVDGQVAGEECAPVVSSLWMGNRTITAAHYDLSNNCALCAAGARRFTLFPPDQIGNLYPGPLEPTPGGQVVSMVDFARPDLNRYPRFANAMAQAQSAVLEPGDVIIYPAMWWHQVEGLEAFNILLNWWWNAAPAYVDTPQITLMHALLSIRQRPAHERAAWRAIFDHYAFGDHDDAAAHLPAHIRGPLGPMDGTLARRLRAVISRKLQR